MFTIATAVGVISSKQPVYSAFNLILCFFGLSVLYLLWDATFIAMIQVLVYAGAILVLFVFVVMLLNLGKSASFYARSWPSLAGVGVTVYLFSLMLLRILNRSLAISPSGGQANDFKHVAHLLFNEYLWPFEVLSVFLLALVVAIVVLAKPTADGEVRP